MTRVPFGTSSSHFLVIATLMHHLNGVDGDLKRTEEHLQKSFYVDDLLVWSLKHQESGAATGPKYIEDAGTTL